MKQTLTYFLSLSILAVILSSCGGGFKKSPLDDIIKEIPREEVFSIILSDMDAQGNFSQSYFHKYQIIRDSNGEVKESTTDWHEVGEKEFNTYINDMGMEIAARDSTGKLTKEVAPPGYNNYVGNSRYGRWENRGGSSFWAFYGQYAFMSSMLRMSAYPINRGYYSSWRGSYYGTGRRYYGPTTGGSSYYGTGSSYNQTRNPNSTWNSKSSSFRNDVRSRTSRSSSRSSRSSSSRSRGGSFGK